MPLTLITAPTTEPLTVAEAKRQLRLGDSAGEPAPTAPTVALASPAVAGNVDNGAHRYRLTFVTADGETEGGTISSAVTVADKTVNGKIELTAIPVGGAAVTSRKLYRTTAGGSSYLLLATVSDNTTTTYTDNIADGSLGAAVPTSNTTEDPEIVRRIASVRDRCELVTGRALITQTWDLVLDGFPVESFIEVPKPPLSSVTHIKYYDTAGDLQTWAVANYDVQAPSGLRCARGRIALSHGIAWPSTYGEIGDVQIRFVCGYGAAGDVPKLLKDGMLIDLGTLDLQREGIVTGTISSVVDGWIGQIYKSFRSYPTQRLEAA